MNHPSTQKFFIFLQLPSTIKTVIHVRTKAKSFFFSRLSMLSNGEMSSLCCCCCFHYIFFFHAWIPSFTKNCHLVIYHLSKKNGSSKFSYSIEDIRTRKHKSYGLFQSSKMSDIFSPLRFAYLILSKCRWFPTFCKETKDSLINWNYCGH